MKKDLSILVETMIKNPVIVNNHWLPEIKKEKLLGIIEFNSESREPAAFIDGGYQCLNAIGIDKHGRLHLSTWSVGGNLPCIEDWAIEEYNQNCIFDGWKIKTVYYADGTVKEFC